MSLVNLEEISYLRLIADIKKNRIELSKYITAWENEDCVFVNIPNEKGTIVHGKYTPFLLEARAKGEDLCEVAIKHEASNFIKTKLP